MIYMLCQREMDSIIGGITRPFLLTIILGVGSTPAYNSRKPDLKTTSSLISSSIESDIRSLLSSGYATIFPPVSRLQNIFNVI